MAESQTAEVRPDAAGETYAGSAFSSLLEKEFKPRNERAKEAVENAVQTLAGFVLKDVRIVSEDAVRTIEAIIAQLDERLTQQVNAILHHEDFQKLEGAWRGLSYAELATEILVDLSVVELV